MSVSYLSVHQQRSVSGGVETCSRAACTLVICTWCILSEKMTFVMEGDDCSD